jgi:hypothetical protein
MAATHSSISTCQRFVIAVSIFSSFSVWAKSNRPLDVEAIQWSICLQDMNLFVYFNPPSIIRSLRISGQDGKSHFISNSSLNPTHEVVGGASMYVPVHILL